MSTSRTIDIPVETTNLNIISGERVTETKQLQMLPCRPDVCQECAGDHLPQLPHNRDSLYYQYKFYAEHDKRWPTWLDAMAHCDQDVQRAWQTELLKLGVKLG